MDDVAFVLVILEYNFHLGKFEFSIAFWVAFLYVGGSEGT